MLRDICIFTLNTNVSDKTKILILEWIDSFDSPIFYFPPNPTFIVSNDNSSIASNDISDDTSNTSTTLAPNRSSCISLLSLMQGKLFCNTLLSFFQSKESKMVKHSLSILHKNLDASFLPSSTLNNLSFACFSLLNSQKYFSSSQDSSFSQKYSSNKDNQSVEEKKFISRKVKEIIGDLLTPFILFENLRDYQDDFTVSDEQSKQNEHLFHFVSTFYSSFSFLLDPTHLLESILERTQKYNQIIPTENIFNSHNFQFEDFDKFFVKNFQFPEKDFQKIFSNFFVDSRKEQQKEMRKEEIENVVNHYQFPSSHQFFHTHPSSSTNSYQLYFWLNWQSASFFISNKLRYCGGNAEKVRKFLF